MDLKKLRDKIKDLKENPEEDIGQIVIDSELKGIKQTVKAVDRLLALDLADCEERLWQEIKDLLKSANTPKKGDR